MALSTCAFPTLDHVVLTGGEPMLQDELPALTAALAARKQAITLETKMNSSKM